MGELVSHVPELLYQKRMTKQEFVLAMMNAGLSHDTAYRLINGDTNFTTETIKVVARVLGVDSISDVMDISGDGA